MDEKTIKFGENIKKYRKLKGLIQQELADKIGVSKATIVNWEHSYYRITASNILKLSKFFEVSMEDLFK